MSARKEKLCFAVVIIVFFCGLICAMSCSPVSPEFQMHVNMANASAQDWLERCVADPNVCKEGLISVADDFQTLADIAAGIEPNGMGVN